MTKFSIIYFILIINAIFITEFNIALSQGFIANEVVYFLPGTGQNSGQDPEYFPENIFKLPPSTAGKNFQAADPKDICSIGMGGEIVLFFKEGYIIDGPGADFTIFENAFVNPVTNKVFAEPAKIAVSENGVDFFEFPFDSLSLQGCAGINWVNGKNNPFDPSVSGGDQFDIADLGLSRIRYVKITDICQMILDNKEHPFYDPIISGFDLDCVVGINVNSTSASVEDYRDDCLFFQYEDYITIEYPSDHTAKTFEIYNVYGEIVISEKFSNYVRFPLYNLSRGVYFTNIFSKNAITRRKFIISR